MKLERSKRYEYGYTLVGNEVFREKNLSLKAKGLFCLMWSLPEDWQFSIEGLVSLGFDGKDSIRSALIELGERGFMSRKPLRNEDGTLAGMSYVLTDQPLAEKPTTVPLSGFPMADNPPLLNTKGLNTNERISLREGESNGVRTPSKPSTTTRTRARFVPPTVEEVAAYCRERRNGLDAEAFVAHYTANGWVQGQGKPIKDWKACVITWEKNRSNRFCQAAAPVSRSRKDEIDDYD